MRRIIIALSIVALTGCADDGTSSGAGGGPAGAPAAAGTEAASATGSAAADAAGATAAQGGAASTAAPAAGRARNVVFVGTSLTAGYGVGEELAYPARLQERIDSAGLPYRVVNAGISGETSAGGLRRIDWVLQQPADVLVLELGANDGLRALPVDELRSNLDEIIRRARAAYPDVAIVLLGMEAPPNLGDAYTSAFRRVYTGLAAEHDAALVPFLLEGVALDASLNIEDGLHPNEAGHRRIARTVWPVLEPVLRQRTTQPPSSDDS